MSPFLMEGDIVALDNKGGGVVPGGAGLDAGGRVLVRPQDGARMVGPFRPARLA